MTAQGNAAPAELARRFEHAWNAHDMTAFAALFHPDATFVNRIGQYWRGRDEVVAQHAALHSGIYRDTTIANRVQDVDLITDDVAIVHVRSNANFGTSMPHGPRKMSAQFMFVATKRDGDWRIQAGHNVGLIDPATGKLIVAD
jgi:uncharacterized protein (TIGR02246 family)